MSRLRFACKVKNNRIIVTDNFFAPDGIYYMELKEASSRSPQQNNYYWFIVDLLAEDLGYTRMEMHQALKDHFEVVSTKTLTVKEFKDYIDRIIRWASMELGVVIPDPK